MRAIGVAEIAGYLSGASPGRSDPARRAGHAQLCQAAIHLAAPPAPADWPRLAPKAMKISTSRYILNFITTMRLTGYFSLPASSM
jgi:hypothetical protein